MADRLAISLHDLGAESGADEGDALDIGAHRTAALLTLRTTVAGAELTASIQTSPDGSTGWRKVGELKAPIGSPSITRRAFDGLERYVRATWPASTDATFVLDGEAHQLYASRDDLPDSVSQEMIDRAEQKRPGARARALIKATGAAESALRPVYPNLPLTTVPIVVTGAVTAIAALQIVTQNGLAGGGIDELIAKNADDARKWLSEVATRKKAIEGIEPAVADAVKGSSGNPLTPDTYAPRFSSDWGDF